MKQKQAPASGNGKPQTADEMAGNKLAGDMAERVNAAIKAADQAVAPQQKSKARRFVVCSICLEVCCPLRYWVEY